MKYQRLTKEQFENLATEFANFLAAQQIDKNEWDNIKQTNPKLADELMDVFSDLIWEGAINNASYLEHFSKSHIFLFQFDQKTIHSYMFKTTNSNINFLSKEGLEWLVAHLADETVEIRQGAKHFGSDKNAEIFELIRQGAILSQGELYQQMHQLLQK